MVVLGQALRYTMRYRSWNEDNEAGEPHLKESRVVNVRDMRFMAIPVGTVLGLTYEDLVPAKACVEVPGHKKPDHEEPGLEELEPKDRDLQQSNLQKDSLEKAGLDRLYDGHATPKYFTVLDAGDQDRISGRWITKQIKTFQDCCTFQEAFLRGMIFTTSIAKSVKIGDRAKDVLRTESVKKISWLSASRGHQYSLRPGPHCIFGKIIYELRRLHDDTYECFVTPITQRTQRQPLKYAIDQNLTSSSNAAVPVPSRLQHHSADPLWLAGKRIAVKDNFDIEGVKTSLCNRAYNAFYPPARSTAACVQKLLDQGAVVVGKTKLSSFAATEEPVECIDWPAPWNPRADGYQSPAGSSSGSAAAIAAYGWLDIAIGSDTSGSGRRPGHWNGVVAMRPTHGVLSTHGRFAEAWYGESLPIVKHELPVNILVPMEYLVEIRNPYQLRLIEGFVYDMEKFFGVPAQRVELESLWAANPPKEAEGRELSDYMKVVSDGLAEHADHFV
ncbi:hypothetical protein SLS58_008978 [Diplodia intermedia]|uniref:Amidase domain-containing protein n=1 Tax=Diplodia intermedia TaxID=856260 RepID=A0ABR3TFC5_9PEZI